MSSADRTWSRSTRPVAAGGAVRTAADAAAPGLRRAGLLATRRHGGHVRNTRNVPDLSALGTDLLTAVPR
ncbi:hypothetical protein [Streptomyces sp. NPDC057740]|uniref:hypothetical protein n=1 Tax=Streptomyces sp. NPDC057740 TaxID=3346234 RepID=UPI0036C77060